MANTISVPTPALPRVLHVLVASPGDVRPERELVEDIIRVLNRKWIKALGLYLDLAKWESAPFSSGVVVDSRATIVEQRADDYDIFIGLLWGRFHTPPPMWVGAGTAKEFEWAYERFFFHQKCEALFFFKEAADPPMQNAEEQARVTEFRVRLGNPGILRRLLAWARGEKVRLAGTFNYGFVDAEQLAALVRDDLTRVVEATVKPSVQTSDEPAEIAHRPRPTPQRRNVRVLLHRLLKSLPLLVGIAVAVTLIGIVGLVLEDYVVGPTYVDEIVQSVGILVMIFFIGRLIWNLGGWGDSGNSGGSRR